MLAHTYYKNDMTFDGLFEKVNTASKVLTSLGVKKGDIVMNLLPNIPESAQIWLGCAQFGATADSMTLQGKIDYLTDEEQIEVVKDIIYNEIIANPTMSSRQIPSKFKIRNSMPITKNGKVDFNSLKNEQLDGTEINVIVNETNLSVDSIDIYKGKKNIKVKIK